MKIRFGMELDSGCWPEIENGREAAVGEVALGPMGLLGVLETAFGMAAPAVPEALRIRQYMERIRALPDGGRFYSRSFAFDAWSSARELLEWRDELVMHGWNGEAAGAPERIAALAEIEQGNAPPGAADRFQAVLRHLRSMSDAEAACVPIRSITLLEALDLLPAPWRALIQALQGAGVALADAACDVAQPDEIVLLESDREWPLAQAVAARVASADDAEQIVLLTQQDTTLLDQALHRAGAPATGQVAGSAQLGLFQLLPLVLENIWSPVRIDRLMELLSVQCSPVPAFAARRLIRALSKSPGLDGEPWRQALSEIATDKARFLIRDGMDEEQAASAAKAFADELDHWLRLDRISAEEEAPCGVMIRVVQRLSRHLAVQASQIPAAAVAMGHCRDMVTILETLDRISKPLLERIVDDVIGPGRSADNRREASAWGVIGDPAQLAAPVDTLIWWGFTDPSSPAAAVWDEAERRWLADHGVMLDEKDTARRRERNSWLSIPGRCKRLLLCRPRELSGNATALHPLWFEIEAEECLRESCSHLDALELFTGTTATLMGQSIGMKPVEPRADTVVSPIKRFDPLPDFRPEKLSPSALGILFGCPFKWLLEQKGVAGSDMMCVPDRRTMIGLLAHQVLEDVFASGSVPGPEEAANSAQESYQRRVPEMAADLLLPENRSDYAETHARIAEAAADVARRFADAGFVRLECETWIRTTLDGIPVHSRADVIAFDAEGRPHVIDFKYSYSNFYRKKIEKGRDVQLITYARMLGKRQSPVAYYLIPKREMVTMFPTFAADVVETDVSIEDGWQRVRKSAASALAQIRSGEVLAAGMLDEAERKAREDACEQNGEVYLEAPCDFCDFSTLCGLNAEGNKDA